MPCRIQYQNRFIHHKITQSIPFLGSVDTFFLSDENSHQTTVKTETKTKRRVTSKQTNLLRRYVLHL